MTEDLEVLLFPFLCVFRDMLLNCVSVKRAHQFELGFCFFLSSFSLVKEQVGNFAHSAPHYKGDGVKCQIFHFMSELLFL